MGSGVLQLTSADPNVQPYLDHNYFAEPLDLERMRKAIRLADHPAFKDIILSFGLLVHIIEEKKGTDVQCASFDIVNGDSQGGHSAGLSTDVRAGLIASEYGRVRGWLEFTTPVSDNPQVSISGTFGVPFCG